MSIEVITGCMFSGKTSELLHRISSCRSIGRRVLAINHSFDNRYDIASSIVSHDKYRLDAVKAKHLQEVDDAINILEDYDVVAIDEGQFFTDLKKFVVKVCEVYDKRVIVCGLMTDAKRNKFGQIVELLHYTTNITYNSALCSRCRDGTRALFTKKLCQNEQQVDIGADEKYVPLCRKCYLK